MKSFETNTTPSVLKFAESAPHVYEALHRIKRTGWVERKVHNPESVKEHTEALIKLAQELSPQLTKEERDELEEMLEVHDWPEALTGDEVYLEENPEKRKVYKEQKFEREKSALETICKDLKNGDEIMRLWLRSESSNEPSGKLVRELDKYQAVEKALEYEETQGIPLFEEFLKYSIKYIQHPLLLERVEKLKGRWQTIKVDSSSK